MKMFSDCSGECCVCACGNGCLAGHGDDDFFPASNQQIIERLNNGKYTNYRQTMIAELLKRGVVYVNPISNKENDLRRRLIEALRNMDYYELVNERLESVNVEAIADKVLETISDYLKGGAENG
jgi:hypothetical protein